MSAMVSCLCLSRGRVGFLQRAVDCYRRQTYSNRELVIVYHGNDTATQAYIQSLDDADIRGVEAPVGPQYMIGALRNIAVEASQGSYVATWDDDDWHAPQRLEACMSVILEHHRPACVLRRCQIYDVLTGQAFVSQPYTWDFSMVCEKACLPAYPNLRFGEDRHVVGQLLRADRLIELEAPELYIYVYHGQNTGGRAHFKRNVFANARPLAGAPLEEIRERLGLNEV